MARQATNGSTEMISLSDNTDTVYLSNNWLDMAETNVSTGWPSDTSTWPTYYTSTYWWPYETKTKIRLLLSEVEHLRKLCKSDRRLRETMQKIAPHIEVEVDFPE